MVAKHILPLVPSLCFYIILVLSAVCFFWGVAGCMNFFLSVLIFCFCIGFIQFTSLCNRFVLSFLFDRQHAELCGFCKAFFGFCRFSFKTHVNLCHRPRPISSIDPLARESRDSSPNARSWAGTVRASVWVGSGTGRDRSGTGRAGFGRGSGRVGRGSGRVGRGSGRVGRGSGRVGRGSGWVGRVCGWDRLAGAGSDISFVMHPASLS